MHSSWNEPAAARAGDSTARGASAAGSKQAAPRLQRFVDGGAVRKCLHRQLTRVHVLRARKGERKSASAGGGSPNYDMDERNFLLNRETAIGYLNSLDRVYIFDGYANWEQGARCKVRVVHRARRLEMRRH